jgi:hypothetical protein
MTSETCCFFCPMTFARPYCRRVHIERFHTPATVCDKQSPLGHTYSIPSPDHPHIVYSSQKIEKTPGYAKTYKHGYCFDCHKELDFRGGITGQKDGRTAVSSHVCITRKKREVYPKTGEAKVRSTPSGKVSVSGMISLRMRRAYGAVADTLVYDRDDNINVEASMMALAARVHSSTASAIHWENVCDDLDDDAEVLSGFLKSARDNYDSAKADYEADPDDNEAPEPIDYRAELVGALNSAKTYQKYQRQAQAALEREKAKTSQLEVRVEELERLVSSQKDIIDRQSAALLQRKQQQEEDYDTIQHE